MALDAEIMQEYENCIIRAYAELQKVDDLMLLSIEFPGHDAEHLVAAVRIIHNAIRELTRAVARARHSNALGSPATANDL
jgi:hypothetical protein